MNLLTDPRLFNFALIALLAAGAIRWAIAGNWCQAVYCASGAVLNVAVMGMK